MPSAGRRDLREQDVAGRLVMVMVACASMHRHDSPIKRLIASHLASTSCADLTPEKV